MPRSHFTNSGSRFDHIPAQWDYYRRLRGISKGKLFDSMQVSVSQGYRLQKHPEEIRLSQYDAACRCLNIPMEERRLYR